MFGTLFERDQDYLRYHHELLGRLDRIERTVRILSAVIQRPPPAAGAWRRAWEDEDAADLDRRVREAGL